MENVIISKCLCGKSPEVKLEKNGRYTIRCVCGLYIPMVATLNDAVRAWNQFAEKNNNAEDIKRIYGYEDDDAPKKKKKRKASKKKSTPKSIDSVEDIAEMEETLDSDDFGNTLDAYEESIDDIEELEE